MYTGSGETGNKSYIINQKKGILDVRSLFRINFQYSRHSTVQN